MLRYITKKVRDMAKNARKRGRSARNGNRPSPYTKYKKTPYIYSQAYRDWKRGVLTNRSTNTPKKKDYREKEYRMAAE